MKSFVIAGLAFLLSCGSCNAQTVPAGQESLRVALGRIVPEPFKVNIDPRVPADTLLQWDDAQDWMAALKQAAAKGNLVVRPRWDIGRIDIAPGQQRTPQAAADTQDSKNTTSTKGSSSPAAPVVASPVTPPAALVAATPAPAAQPPVPAPAQMPTASAIQAREHPKEEAPKASAPEAAQKPMPQPLTSAKADSVPPSAAAATQGVEKVRKDPKAQLWAVQIKDLTLANTFQRWASAAGWRVRWDAAKNVMVEAPDTFSGTFEEAITAQLSTPGIAFSSYPLEVCFYPNTPPLARITRKGEQAKECQ